MSHTPGPRAARFCNCDYGDDRAMVSHAPFCDFAPKPERLRCAAMLAGGTQCKYEASVPSGLCTIHRRARDRAIAKSAGTNK